MITASLINLEEDGQLRREDCALAQASELAGGEAGILTGENSDERRAPPLSVTLASTSQNRFLSNLAGVKARRHYQNGSCLRLYT